MKICAKCKKYKKLTEFYNKKDAKDKHLYICKKCSYIVYKLYRLNNKEKVKEYSKKYADDKREHLRKCRKEYRENNKTKIAKYHKEYMRYYLSIPEQKEKHNVRLKTRLLIKKGTIKKQLCEVCHKEAFPHHNDYSNAYNIKWLCKKHHIELHIKLNRNNHE